jgi:hypothetical protein
MFKKIKRFGASALSCGQNNLILQSFVIVQQNLVEHYCETNLSAASAQTDKQAWLQGAHGHKKRAQSALPPQS